MMPIPIPIPATLNWNRIFGLAVRRERLRPGAAQAKPACAANTSGPVWASVFEPNSSMNSYQFRSSLPGFIMGSCQLNLPAVSRHFRLELV